jgi:hypothetical protein
MKETTGGILSPKDTNGYYFRSGEQQWFAGYVVSGVHMNS